MDQGWSITPGDDVQASTTFDTSTNPYYYDFMVMDATTGYTEFWSTPIYDGDGMTQYYLTTADFIVERPTFNGVDTPLRNFVETYVNRAQADDGSGLLGMQNSAYTRHQYQMWNLQSPSSQLAQTSSYRLSYGLYPSSFNVTWKKCG
jgi:hypothetical protein